MTEKVPYHTICSCNPANGGSGICGCIMGNKLVDPGMHGNLRTRPTQHVPIDWWQGPHIEHMPSEKPFIDTHNSRLVKFIETRIVECQKTVEMSDNPAYYRGKIAAYQEMLEELKINNK
jgi:hypothetical protein